MTSKHLWKDVASYMERVSRKKSNLHCDASHSLYIVSVFSFSGRFKWSSVCPTFPV